MGIAQVRIVPGDYDRDNDGLIEVSNLGQLNAMRWDLDGDGSSNDDRFARVFTDIVDHTGCPARACIGYELYADLDFDTDVSGSANLNDAYWNDGSGWEPIGDAADPYNAVFEGNGHTISNLFVDRGGRYVGLFGSTGASSIIRNLGLLDLDVTGRSEVGGLAGANRGEVSTTFVTGRVTGRYAAGGMIGENLGNIYASYSIADVIGQYWAGVLLGDHRTPGTVTASYASGTVSADEYAGGLIGIGGASDVYASYSTSSVTGPERFVGGLLGYADYSFSSSYWDIETSGVSTGHGGVGMTTNQLRNPTSYSDAIYAEWNVDVDGDGIADDPWDFGTDAQFPALKADVNGDGQATWQEFGDQRRETPLARLSQPKAESGAGFMVLSWTPAPGARHGYDYRYSESASDLEAGAGPSWNHVANSNIASDHIVIPSGHLTIGTTYYFQVRGVDIDGNAGPASDVSERVIQLAVPSQVDNLTSSAGDGRVTLAWRAPLAVELVIGYQYRVNPDPDGGTGWSDWSVLSTSDTTPNQSDVAGLTNGVAYSFQVRAVSAVGEAAEVSTTSATPVGPPAVPRDLSAKAGDAQVSLSWIDPNDSSITRYQYRQRVATEDVWPPNWTDIPSGAETTTSHVVTGLNNDTEYFFQAHATSAGGNSVPSEVSATPAVGTTAPPKLQNVKAIGSRESGRIQITWNDPGDPDISNMHHYQFRRDANSPNPVSWDTDWSSISGRDYFKVADGTVSWDSPVGADQSWFYQLRAVNDRGTYKTGDDLYGAASNSVLAGTLTDEIPQVSSALPSRPFWRQWSAWSGTISVHWQDPEDPSITHYQIKWKQDEGDYGDWQDIQHSGYGEIHSTSFTASGLTNGVQYTLEGV